MIEGAFIPQAFPVISAPSNPNQHQQVVLDWKLARKGQKMVMQYGLTNPYVQTLLDHIFTSGLMVPFDCKKLTDTFLKPTQRLLWQADWEKQVDDAVIENLRLPQGDPRQLTTPDMVLGKEPFAVLQAQARLHAAVLQQSQKLAWEAFHAVPHMGLSSSSYTTIKQEVKETFMSFLDHFRGAID